MPTSTLICILSTFGLTFLNIKIFTFFMTSLHLILFIPIIITLIAYIGMYINSAKLGQQLKIKDVIYKLTFTFTISCIVCLIRYNISDIYPIMSEFFTLIYCLHNGMYVSGNISNYAFLGDISNANDTTTNNIKLSFSSTERGDGKLGIKALYMRNNAGSSNTNTASTTSTGSSGPGYDPVRETLFINKNDEAKQSLKNNLEALQPKNWVVKGQRLIIYDGTNYTAAIFRLKLMDFPVRAAYAEAIASNIPKRVSLINDPNITPVETEKLNNDIRNLSKLHNKILLDYESDLAKNYNQNGTTTKDMLDIQKQLRDTIYNECNKSLPINNKLSYPGKDNNPGLKVPNKTKGISRMLPESWKKK